MNAPIEIVVDELVVRGLPAAAARVEAASFKDQLAALAVAHRGAIAPHVESFGRLPAVEAPSGRGGALGEAVAGAVWEHVAGGPR